MRQQLSITLSDYVIESYLAHIKKNRSAYLERLIVLGAETEIGQIEGTKSKLLSVLQQLRERDDEISKLKGQVAQLKQEKQQQGRKERYPGEFDGI